MIAKVTNREQDFFAELINRVPDWVICSELQIKALIEAGRMLPEHANYDPDRLWDMRMTELVTGDWYILDHSYGWSDYMNA
jgi:L-rhamnose isomerase